MKHLTTLGPPRLAADVRMTGACEGEGSQSLVTSAATARWVAADIRRLRLLLCRSIVSLLMALLLVPGCSKTPSVGPQTKPSDKLKIGYVLHGLNDFTQIIKQGADDAARAENVLVDV